MKNAIVIALALVSVASFAGTKPTKEQKKAAMEACKEQKADKKAHKACMKEHLAAPAAEAKTETAPAAPAAESAHK